ncbi:UNVERIFIED_CONTAM: hypothetical protein Slati_2480300 [Sesamum latifolium]|uniref:Uncharacterized protein n=1 Tax=Sesamum latifolium TaxID=2727402 RepID=A0AAW2WEY4_9LAMI
MRAEQRDEMGELLRHQGRMKASLTSPSFRGWWHPMSRRSGKGMQRLLVQKTRDGEVAEVPHGIGK